MKDEARLDQLFAEALQKPLAVRTEFVTRECGSDTTLQQELLSLLTAADESAEFMAASALDRLAEDVARDGWTIRAGDRVGAYTILRLLGSGGAGQVWCARDERLGREVAIKMLLPFLASDPDRIRRFADEARLAGALNHSNILAVYDVGEHGGSPFLVSERLEGETLRARLAKGRLPVDKAIAIALNIARGLTAAHARGILHRDLKPENVFLGNDGGVKILDFGVATLLPSADAVQTDTLQTVGAIVGTAAYMAPEQATGARLDARTDLFALGVTMYEMLGGERPFCGTSTIETLHAVLTTDPPALVAVNPDVPDALAAIIHRLLEKVPDARFQSAADLAWALEHLPPAASPARVAVGGVSQSPVKTAWLPWAAAALVLLAFGTWALLRPSSVERPVAELDQFSWSLPAGITLDSAPAVSPDSRRVALIGRDKNEISRLFIRERGEGDARAIAGTDGAKQPFWSPDGDSIGFFANGKLMKVATQGGAPVELAPAPDARGGSWSATGTIVFQPDYRDTALVRVPAGGGAAEPVTRLDVTGPDVTHRWPVFVDDVHFLYLILSTDETRRGVYLGSTAASPEERPVRLFRSSSGPVYVPLPDRSAGLLLSAEGQWIEARRFDLTRLAVVGDARRIALAAAGATPHHAALLGASSDLLAFSSMPIPYGAHVAAVNSAGDGLEVWPERELGQFLRLSPDGGRLAQVRLNPVDSNPDIWVHDLKRGGRLRISTTRDLDVLPVWSPEGDRIAYRSGTNAVPALKISAADGSGIVKTLSCPRPYCEATDWTGAALIVNVSGGDVWSVPIDGSAPSPLLQKPFMERDARISPDGKWIIYVSEESGGPEVSVQSLTGPERRFPVSTGGGDQPVWSRGNEVYYVNPEGFLQAVSVQKTADGGLTFGTPRPLKVPRFGERHWGTTYDVNPVTGRVYFPYAGDEPFPQSINVILGWQAMIK